MAADLPNENELREGIRSRRYKIDVLMLKALDFILSDYLFAIVLSVRNYMEDDVPMDMKHAEELLNYSRKMNHIFLSIIHPQKIVDSDNALLQEIKKKDAQMDKEVRNWLIHHIGNDSQAINFIIGDFVDDKSPVPVESLVERVLPRITAMESVFHVLLEPVRRKSQE